MIDLPVFAICTGKNQDTATYKIIRQKTEEAINSLKKRSEDRNEVYVVEAYDTFLSIKNVLYEKKKSSSKENSKTEIC